MVKTQLRILLGIALFMMVLSAPAYADTIINFNGCGSCNGNSISLLIHPTGTNNYTVTLTINTNGNTASGLGIAAVSFKIDSGGGVTGATLSDFLINGTSQGTAGWSPTSIVNSLNASTACGSSTSTGFACSEDSAYVGGGTSPLAPFNSSTNPTYAWVWTNVSLNGPFNQATNHIHVGAIFGKLNSNSGKWGQILSEEGIGSTYIPPTNPVPEPGSLMLFGTGLIGLGGLLRWRMR